MGLSFVHPDALWLLLALPILWIAALYAPLRTARWRRWSSLTLRTLIALLLIGAISGTQLVQPLGATTTIFLLDGSDSVAASQRARAEVFVAQALAAMPPDDRAGVVVFGREALVERPPATERTLGAPAARPAGGATNVAEALQLGLALFPAEGHQRLVLLSDGGENVGNARSTAQLAAARGVPIDVVPLSGEADGLDAQIVTVTLPPAAREGQRLPLRADLESNAPVAGHLVVIGPDGKAIATVPVDVGPVRQTIEVLLPEAPAAFNRYTVRLDVPGDTRTQNNAAEAFSYVSGRPRVLLVAQSPNDSANLERALRAAQIDVAVVAPDDFPATLGELSLYDVTALVNVPRRLFPDQALQLLAAYVHDLGHGLFMIGGPQSLGPGNWRNTPVEDVLPVTMDIPERLRHPATSVVVVIDISGSMAALEGGHSKLSLAIEGAQRIAALLRDDDELTVIPFDNRPGFIVGPLPGAQRETAIEQLNQVQLGGGGINIHDALDVAARYVRATDRPIRHIITITDGNDTTQQEGALDVIRGLRDDGVTLTSIAIGSGDHVPFVRNMAMVGGGRTFLTERAADLPDILVNEAEAVIQPYIIEGTFAPRRGAPHPALRGADAAPELGGYVIATPRMSAQVLLAAPGGDPVLAAWQHGLGRSLVWTSDFTARWARSWVTWEAFPQVSAQLVGWLSPIRSYDTLAIESHVVGDSLVLEAAIRTPGGEPLAGLNVVARLIASTGESVEMALREISPDTYRASLTDHTPGAYLVQIVATDEQGGLVASATGGALMPLSTEYRSQAGNRSLLEDLARTTGGRIDPQPSQVFEPNAGSRGAVREIGMSLLWLALLLLPLDVALRRLLVQQEQVADVLRRAGLAALAARVAAAHAPSDHDDTPPRTPRLPPFRHTDAAPRSTTFQETPEEHAQRIAELERLRAAQEAARRRLRGEE